MTIVDSQHVLSQAQAPTVTAGTASYSTQSFDLTPNITTPNKWTGGGNQIRYLGWGTTLWVNFRITSTWAGTNTATISVGTDAQSPIAAGYTSHASVTIAKTTLVYGYLFAIPIPADTILPERYLGVAYLPNTTDLAASAAITAWVDNHPAEQAIVYDSALYFV